MDRKDDEEVISSDEDGPDNVAPPTFIEGAILLQYNTRTQALDSLNHSLMTILLSK